MLVVEPERRLTITQIMAHPWICIDSVVETETIGLVDYKKLLLLSLFLFTKFIYNV